MSYYWNDDVYRSGDLVRFWEDRIGTVISKALRYHPFGDWYIAGLDGQRYVVAEDKMEFITDIPLEMLAVQAHD